MSFFESRGKCERCRRRRLLAQGCCRECGGESITRRKAVARVNPYRVVATRLGRQTTADALVAGVRFKTITTLAGELPKASTITYTATGPSEATHPTHRGSVRFTDSQPVVLVE